MNRCAATAALLLFMAISAPAHAQALRMDFELQAEHCDNRNGDVAPALVVQACTNIIRAENVSGPATIAAFEARGDAYLAQGNAARAIADYGAVIEREPTAGRAFIARGAAYVYQRNFQAAAADYDRAITLIPDWPVLYGARCRARALWGQYLDQAKGDCDRALAADAGYVPALQSEGLIAMRENRFEDAWRNFDDALKVDAQNAFSLAGRTAAAQRLGREQGQPVNLDAAAQSDTAQANLALLRRIALASGAFAVAPIIPH